MSSVLTVEQREQAGSDSYNRFEYQVHWIVCHIIGKLQEDAECIVFCEFHDDMAEFSPNNQQYQFFQIKTKEDSSDWTIAEMSKREKKKSGSYKKSFLGFIFYNYLTFGAECSHCHFVSNNDFDKEVLLWQSYIEDGKRLQTENIALYEKIKDRIKNEFLDDMPSNFDSVFEEFIQNTFVHKSELQLTTYESQTMGKFFNHLADKNIPSNTANLIFQQLLNDVRKKSKEKIKVPISMKSLVEKKGVDIAQIGKKIDGNIKNSGNYDAFHDYLDDRYYELQAQKAEYILEKDDKKKELNYNQSFVSRITSTLTQIEHIESVEEVTTDIESLLDKAEELRKMQFSYNAEMTVLENDIYVNQHKLHVVEHNLIETKKDIEFAMTQEDELVCPICGTIYSNGLEEQLNITSDYAHCEKLITELRNSISIATEELEELKEKYNGVSLEIQSIEQKVRNSQQLLSYSSFYKNKGQYEIYESCKRQLEVLQGEIDSYVSKIAIIDEKINEKKSKERSKDIREDIEGYCRTLADAINLPKTFIKLRDFVQIIDRTGSETPRLVYMYQSALYLYNLYRTNSPFNFYVVDTPNQQGQDAENLGSIFKSLELFLSDEGQVIVGTERETGLEGKASNVIKLTEKRRCLNTINYSKHLELLEELQKTAISWVAFNHKAKNEK